MLCTLESQQETFNCIRYVVKVHHIPYTYIYTVYVYSFSLHGIRYKGTPYTIYLNIVYVLKFQQVTSDRMVMYTVTVHQL